jgi:hypothetical protein
MLVPMDRLIAIQQRNKTELSNNVNPLALQPLDLNKCGRKKWVQNEFEGSRSLRVYMYGAGGEKHCTGSSQFEEEGAELSKAGEVRYMWMYAMCEMDIVFRSSGEDGRNEGKGGGVVMKSSS